MREVALGQREHDVDDVLDAGAGRRDQQVQALAHFFLEALQAGQIDARLEVSAAGRAHDLALAFDDLRQASNHLLQREQHALLVALAQRDLGRQVTVGHAAQQLGGHRRVAAQLARHDARDHQAQRDRHHHRCGDDARQHAARTGNRLFAGFVGGLRLRGEILDQARDDAFHAVDRLARAVVADLGRFAVLARRGQVGHLVVLRQVVRQLRLELGQQVLLLGGQVGLAVRVDGLPELVHVHLGALDGILDLVRILQGRQAHVGTRMRGEPGAGLRHHLRRQHGAGIGLRQHAAEIGQAHHRIDPDRRGQHRAQEEREEKLVGQLEAQEPVHEETL